MDTSSREHKALWSGDGVNVIATVPGSWRVTDHPTATSGAGVLGFIHARESFYEVTSTDRPLEWAYFDSLAAAIDSFQPLTRRAIPVAADTSVLHPESTRLQEVDTTGGYDEVLRWPNGNLSYLYRGVLHRTNGPAFVGANGAEHWLQHGREHRLGGPAVRSPDEADEYWVNGIQITNH